MLQDILYSLQAQIRTHLCNRAGRGDLRILMSEYQLREMEQLMWANHTGLMSAYDHYGFEPPRGLKPARYHGVEIVPTVMDMPLPTVVRLASI